LKYSTFIDKYDYFFTKSVLVIDEAFWSCRLIHNFFTFVSLLAAGLYATYSLHRFFQLF